MAKVRVPKRIGGFKVPKGLRKSPVVKGLLRNPIGQELVAGALVAGATAAASALARHGPSAGQVAGAGRAVATEGAQAASAGKDALWDAAESLASTFRQAAGLDPADDKPRRKGKRMSRELRRDRELRASH